MAGGWRLRERVVTSGGEEAFDVFGEGSPVVLVHGTPGFSFLWRNVVAGLAGRHAVYVYDLPGFGASEGYEGQDVSISAQGRVLAELVEGWGLEGREAYLRKDAALLQRDTAEVEPLLGSVGAPVRVVWGEEDGWLDPSQAEVLAGRIPDAGVRFVAGAGHFVTEDAPGEVAEIVAGFFAPRGVT